VRGTERGGGEGGSTGRRLWRFCIGALCEGGGGVFRGERGNEVKRWAGIGDSRLAECRAEGGGGGSCRLFREEWCLLTNNEWMSVGR
jgi:hypothetical protein